MASRWKISLAKDKSFMLPRTVIKISLHEKPELSTVSFSFVSSRILSDSKSTWTYSEGRNKLFSFWYLRFSIIHLKSEVVPWESYLELQR